MKRFFQSSHFLLTAHLTTLLSIQVLIAAAYGQTSLSASREPDLFYQPEHLVWARSRNNQWKRQDLLPLLSRRQVVIVLEQPDDEQKQRVEAFLRQPPATLPAIDTYRPLPLSRETESYAIGYIQDASRRRPTPASQAAAYLVTLKVVQPIGVILKALHDLQHLPQIDYALPVFTLPGKTVAPFIQFDVEFLAPELILGGAAQIQRLNSRSYVKAADPERGLQGPVVLQLQKDAPSNILATVLRYQQMPGVVRQAKLRWLRVRQLVEIRSRWDASSGVNSFGIWEAIPYVLSIERDRDVELLPKAFTEGAVYAWLAENTHLPSALIQVDAIAKRTQTLDNGRLLDEITIRFRLSKTGTYIFAPYAVQAAFRGLDAQNRIETFRSEQPAFLTIPGHLPRQLRQIPGRLLTLPERRVQPWLWRSSAALGVVCLAVGIGCFVKIARRASPSARAMAPDAPAPSLEVLQADWRDRLKEIALPLAALSFQGDMEQERAWLRSLNVYVKRWLGGRWYQDEQRFLGGLGTSSEAIKRVMQGTAIDPEQAPIDEALRLLSAIEQQVMKQTIALSKDEAEAFYARAASLTTQSLA